MGLSEHTRAAAETRKREARDRQHGVLPPTDSHDTPEAVPRARALRSISLRVPEQMLIALKVMARREGVGYQVLLKRWLDDRIREEWRRSRDDGPQGL
jgi:hypothetical protein